MKKSSYIRIFSLLFIPLGLLLVAFLLVPPVGACDQADHSSLMTTKCTRYLSDDPSRVFEYPNYLEAVTSSDLKTSLVRVTNDGDEFDRGVHHYSKRQVWNSDGSLMLLSKSILDANDYSVFREQLKVSSAMNWSNTNPHIVFGVSYDPEPNALVSWNVVTDETVLIEKFDKYSACSFGDGEGNLSNDDRFILLACKIADSEDKYLVSYDIARKLVLGEIQAHENFNWGSFTRTGKYVIVENNSGPLETRELIRYSMDLKDKFVLTHKVEHGDLALTPEGDEFYIMIDQQNVLMLNIETAKVSKTPLTLSRSSAGFGHVSCLSSATTGRCLLSTLGSGELSNFYFGSDPYWAVSRGFEFVGYHQASSADYFSTPKASVNRDSSKFVFSSDWNLEYATEEFVIELVPQ